MTSVQLKLDRVVLTVARACYRAALATYEERGFVGELKFLTNTMVSSANRTFLTNTISSLVVFFPNSAELVVDGSNFSFLEQVPSAASPPSPPRLEERAPLICFQIYPISPPLCICQNIIKMLTSVQHVSKYKVLRKTLPVVPRGSSTFPCAVGPVRFPAAVKTSTFPCAKKNNPSLLKVPSKKIKRQKKEILRFFFVPV